MDQALRSNDSTARVARTRPHLVHVAFAILLAAQGAALGVIASLAVRCRLAEGRWPRNAYAAYEAAMRLRPHAADSWYAPVSSFGTADPKGYGLHADVAALALEALPALFLLAAAAGILAI